MLDPRSLIRGDKRQKAKGKSDSILKQCPEGGMFAQSVVGPYFLVDHRFLLATAYLINR
jgi:hypothetical protein